jgi:threonine aldolase
MPPFNRRSFLKRTSLGLLPVIIPFQHAFTDSEVKKNITTQAGNRIVKLFGDGIMFEPADYLNKLQSIQAQTPIVSDRYGVGGAVQSLEKKFAELTGKEKAIFMPSGTMANQLAISVLSGENAKVFVQDTSHIYRDEGDAAQTVFNKRLMPLAKDQTYFTAEQLQKAIDELPNQEVFNAGIGAVAIENPVRRSEGKMVPIDEIKKISAYCRAKNIKLHLDGARLFLASAWSGISIQDYSSYFDTVYISLYKYLGASGGAILCGDAKVIEKMPHLMKVHGGSMYGNWANAAMALHQLDGFETRLQAAIARADEMMAALNKVPGLELKKIKDGTNFYTMQIPKEVNAKAMQSKLSEEFGVLIPRLNQDNFAMFNVNETLLHQSSAYLINAFKKSMIS